MAEFYESLPSREEQPQASARATRVASLDVLRGLSVFLMMLVDYGGSFFPIIGHAPWNGVHLADFVMPFFLISAGVSLALAYKKVPNRVEATRKAVLRAVKLFLLGIILQAVVEFLQVLSNSIMHLFCLIGCTISRYFKKCIRFYVIDYFSGGYLHGITSLTYGVDVERIRWLGILQRISFGYIVAALCEIWLPSHTNRVVDSFFKRNHAQWCIIVSLSAIYLGLSYGLFVPDWKFTSSNSTPSLLLPNDSYVYTVNCSIRGDFSPGCNSAGMIDRYILGIDHLYMKPTYRNLKECNLSIDGQVPESSPSWCHAPFDPEGILSSIMASVTCIIGLQYGHTLAHLQDHKERLSNWIIFSVSLLVVGLFLAVMGIPVNKSLYTVSYMLITSAVAGITFCGLYVLVDVYSYRYLAFPLEWMGKHSLAIFVLVISNLVFMVVQGFYWQSPENNIVHWFVTPLVHK